MKILIMLLLTIPSYCQIKILKNEVIINNVRVEIIDRKLLYKDTIYYLKEDVSIRVSGDKLYYYSPKTYAKYEYNKRLHYFMIL